MGRDDAILSTQLHVQPTSGVLKVLQITVRLGKTHCSPYKFKIAGLRYMVKKWTICGTFGPNFPLFFLLVYGHLRAAGVPIGPL
jgi:hypothetical protein